MRCPECDEPIFAAAAWSEPDHDPQPGMLCPHCNAFIPDDDDFGDDDEDAEDFRDYYDDEEP